jgi:hypothetical protein
VTAKETMELIQIALSNFASEFPGANLKGASLEGGPKSAKLYFTTDDGTHKQAWVISSADIKAVKGGMEAGPLATCPCSEHPPHETFGEYLGLKECPECGAQGGEPHIGH